MSFSFDQVQSRNPWLSEDRGRYTVHQLNLCTTHVATGSIEEASKSLERISQIAAPDGDMIQRIAAYFSKALADRLLKSWSGLYKAVNSTRTISSYETNLVRKLFYELCPFLKVSYVVTNQAIVEAMEGEKAVHIIDLNSFEPAQWIDLMHTLSARPDGPPDYLRISGVHEQEDVLEQMRIRLMEEAKKLRLTFQFIPIVEKLEDLGLESFRVKAGAAVAVSSVLQLHTLLANDHEMHIERNQGNQDATINSLPTILMHQNRRTTLKLGQRLEDTSINLHTPGPSLVLSPPSLANSPKLVGFLGAVLSISPKIVVITEQECDHNAETLTERANDAFHYYSAIFHCLETTISKRKIEREKLEKILFGEEIKNIIACEGNERKERHEKLQKWIPRMEMSGFNKIPMSYQGKIVASRLMRGYGYNGYKIREENGSLLICWYDMPLYSVSSWICRGD